MSRPSSPSSGRISLPPFPVKGNLLGTAIVGGIDWFIGRYGPAAAHAVIAGLSAPHRLFVTPNAPSLGILGARRYPYPFVGDLTRSMVRVAAVAPSDDDALVRQLSIAGAEAALGTVSRGLLRFVVTPSIFARGAQEMWSEFHDSGRLVVTVTEHEYVTDVTEWANHDATVCAMCAAACGWIIERTGKRGVETSRVKCQAWGHPSCVSRVRWA